MKDNNLNLSYKKKKSLKIIHTRENVRIIFNYYFSAAKKKPQCSIHLAPV